MNRTFAKRLAGRIVREFVRVSSRTACGRPDPQMDQNGALAIIRECQPQAVLDVGANEGQFALALRSSGYRGRIVSFEPQGEPFTRLLAASAGDPQWDCHHLAFGDFPAQLELHVSGESVCSSLLPIGERHIELMPRTAEVGRETVTVHRLDAWLACHPDLARGPLFLKIDTQGYEMRVLSGASGIITKVCGVLAEAMFEDLYEGQSKCYDIMRVLSEAGLSFHGFFDVHHDASTNACLWGELLYVRHKVNVA